MKRAITYTCAAFLMVFALASTSCDSENSNYDVTVGWTMMGFQTCETMPLPQLNNETLVFEEVHIEVFEEENTDDPIIFDDVPCDDYFYTIQNLDEGEYVVTLDAMADYEGQNIAFFQMTMDVEAPAEEDEYVDDWEVGKGTVQVSWGFESGFCVGNGVDSIDITLESVTGSADFDENGVDCVDEIYVFEEIQWDTYRVVVRGYDMDGTQTHYGESDEDFEVLPGSQINQIVTLLEM